MLSRPLHLTLFLLSLYSNEAISLLEEMQDQGLRPNTAIFNNAITACSKAGEWESALQVWNLMKATGVHPDVVSLETMLHHTRAVVLDDDRFLLWLGFYPISTARPHIIPSLGLVLLPASRNEPKPS